MKRLIIITLSLITISCIDSNNQNKINLDNSIAINNDSNKQRNAKFPFNMVYPSDQSVNVALDTDIRLSYEIDDLTLETGTKDELNSIVEKLIKIYTDAGKIVNYNIVESINDSNGRYTLVIKPTQLSSNTKYILQVSDQIEKTITYWFSTAIENSLRGVKYEVNSDRVDVYFNGTVQFSEVNELYLVFNGDRYYISDGQINNPIGNYYIEVPNDIGLSDSKLIIVDSFSDNSNNKIPIEISNIFEYSKSNGFYTINLNVLEDCTSNLMCKGIIH